MISQAKGLSDPAPRAPQEIAETAQAATAAGDWSAAVAGWAEFRAASPFDVAGYVEGAAALRYAGRLDEAVLLAETAIWKFTAEAGPTAELAWCRWTSGDIEGAARHGETLRERFPANPDGYVIGAITLMALGRDDEAETIAEAGMTRFPDDEALSREYALFPSRRGDWDEASQRLARLRQRFPDVIDAYTLDILALRQTGQLDAAEALARDAVARFPHSIEPQIEYAWIESARGQWRAVLERCGSLRERFPDDPRASTLTMIALRNLDEIEPAEHLAAEALVNFPDEAPLRIEHAALAAHRGDWAEADARLAALRRRLPEVSEGWSYGSLVLRRAGRLADAEALAEAGMTRFPAEPALLVEFVQIALDAGRQAEAQQRAATLRERFPEVADGYRLGAFVLREIGGFDKARDLADAGLSRLPDEVGLLHERAFIETLAGEWATAAMRWHDFRTRFPDDAEGYRWGAQALREQQEFASGTELLAVARRQFPDDATILFEEVLLACDLKDWPVVLDRCAALRIASVDYAAAYSGAAVALLHMSRYDEAETMSATAVERYPLDWFSWVQYAEAATRRLDWAEARRRWTELRDRFPARPEGSDGLMNLETMAAFQRVDEEGPRPAEHTGDEAAAITTVERELLLEFESLGENCEFGIVQRGFGAEPLGLLRWSSIEPGSVLALLESRFDGVGLAENTVVTVGATSEYDAGDKRYFTMHTFLHDSDISAEQVHKKMCRRLAFLKDKMIEDLTEGRKIFVYKNVEGTMSDAEIVKMWQAIRQYGPGQLLCVRPVSKGHEAGQVDQVADGLFHGYMEELTLDPLAARSYLGSWLTICQQTHELAFVDPSGWRLSE